MAPPQLSLLLWACWSFHLFLFPGMSLSGFSSSVLLLSSPHLSHTLTSHHETVRARKQFELKHSFHITWFQIKKQEAFNPLRAFSPSFLGLLGFQTPRKPCVSEWVSDGHWCFLDLVLPLVLPRGHSTGIQECLDIISQPYSRFLVLPVLGCVCSVGKILFQMYEEMNLWLHVFHFIPQFEVQKCKWLNLKPQK